MIKLLLTKLIRGYQYFISPLFPSRCRFYPTCSDYAIEAITLHGPAKGGWLAARRIARCHPFGPSGFDPVPGTESVYSMGNKRSNEGERNSEIQNGDASEQKTSTGCNCSKEDKDS